MNIGARECTVKEISEIVCNPFLTRYHSQGEVTGQKVCLSLFYKDEIVGVMTFGYPRYNHNVSWELLRLCYRPDVHIAGGSQKLFNYFIANKQPDNIISYCNLDEFKGTTYLELDFVSLGTARETFKWVKDNRWISDSELRKYGADKLIGTADGKGTSNEEIMKREGWQKIHYQTVQTYLWDSKIEGIIYLITNTVNGKQYVGQCKYNDDRRWKEHCRCATLDEPGSIISSAIKKYGKENFTYEVVDAASSFYELNKKERAWIIKLNPQYNIQPGRHYAYVYTPTEEIRQKISLASKGRKPSLEQRKRQSEAQRGKLHKPHSEETKAKIGIASRNRVVTDETRKKMSEAQKKVGTTSARLAAAKKAGEARRGLPMPENCRIALLDALVGHEVSQETRQKISQAHLGKQVTEEQRENMRQAHLGKTLSEEQKRKIGESHKGKKRSPEARARMAAAQQRAAQERAKLKNAEK